MEGHAGARGDAYYPIYSPLNKKIGIIDLQKYDQEIGGEEE